MGNIISCVQNSDSLSISDWIGIAEIIVNLILALWIINSIQKNMTNRRFLKDHLIDELKDLKSFYKYHIKEMYNGNLKPRTLIPWYKLMNIKSDELIRLIEDNFQIKSSDLRAYLVNLRAIVLGSSEYENNFSSNRKIKMTADLEKEILQFQQKNNGVFNKLIIGINNK